MTASVFLTVMATAFSAITFALDTRDTLHYFTAGFGFVWSVAELVFSVVRRSLGLFSPTTKIWAVLVVNIIMMIAGATETILIAMVLGPVNLRIGVPFFGLAIAVTLFEILCIWGLIQNRRFREGQVALDENSIKSSKVLFWRLILSLFGHALVAVPAYYFWKMTDPILIYIPILTIIYIGCIFITNLYGFYASKQSSELITLIIYFIASLVVAFIGAFLLLMICTEVASYEVGLHPLLFSISLFGSGIVAWVFQLGCIHRAWLLIKYRNQIRKSLEFHYSKKFRDDDDGFSDLAMQTQSDYYGESSVGEDVPLYNSASIIGGISNYSDDDLDELSD